jgi:hypothetical protein
MRFVLNWIDRNNQFLVNLYIYGNEEMGLVEIFLIDEAMES